MIAILTTPPSFLDVLPVGLHCCVDVLYTGDTLKCDTGAVILRAGIECKESRYLSVSSFYRLRFHCAQQGTVTAREKLRSNQNVLEQCHDRIRTLKQYNW